MAKVKKEDDLTQLLAETLNKKSKEGKVAHFLSDDGTPSNVLGWISTGNAMLDIAISNRPNGGFPIGRIIELNGLEQSGKSLLAAHALASTQQQNGVAVMIDTESAVSREFLEAIGVDISKLLYVPSDSVEQVFEYIETIIEKVRQTSKDKPVTIVVDSVAAASTEKELEADYGKDGYATDKAIILSKAMRKITNMIGREKITLIFTNQLRQKMNAVPFSDPWTTSGGKSISFHSSVIIRLSSAGTIKTKINGIDTAIGIKVKAQIKKNRMGPPLRTSEFEIYFDRGIDNYGAWFKIMKDYGLISGAGAWYTYTDEETGEIIKFQSKDWMELLETRTELRDQIYHKICEATILKYKSASTDMDALELDTSDGDGVHDVDVVD
jgi:recombination protein RecA